MEPSMFWLFWFEHIVHDDNLLISLLITIYSKQKLPQQELKDAVIYGYNETSLEDRIKQPTGGLILQLFCIIIVVDSSLKIMPHLDICSYFH